MTTRRAHPLLQAWQGVMVAALLVWAQPAAAQGTPTDVCVSLTGSNGQVSGLQMDLSWDLGCMTADTASGSAAQCNSNPSTGKNVQTNFLPDGSLRVLFLSISDQSPIPDDELFCCKFTMVGSQTGSCCSVATSSIIFSGPKGARVYDPNAKLNVVVGGGAPCVSSIAGGSPDNPVRPSVPAAAIVQPQVMSAPAAPAAPAPGAVPALMPRPNIPAQAPPVQGLPAEAPAPELAPTESAPSQGVTPAAAATSTAGRAAAARTPARPTATAPEATPQVQGTPTGPAPSVTAPAPSTTQPATTPTPKPKHERHKKRRSASQE
jgi:hypothetical protein